MTRIDPLRAGWGIFPSLKRGKRKDGAVDEDAGGTGADGFPAGMAALAEEIGNTGKILSEDPTGGHLELYRKSVKRFLDTAVTDSMRVDTEANQGLSRKVFSTITRVDMALGEMADAVLGRQRDMVKVEALLDQIKGMLIDLYR